MPDDFAKRVFDTLNGRYVFCGGVPGVENAFSDGGACLRLYGDALRAYDSLCARFGEEDDADVEVIFNAFLDIIEIMGMKMYHYGALFGESPEQE